MHRPAAAGTGARAGPTARPRRRCAPRPSLPRARAARAGAGARRARALAPEDQKAHEDAKRFARLVVSEIKLYNEAKVTEGRKTRTSTSA